ncbi:CelD-like protein [Sphingobium indicum IP26]|uniref:CelD-like protein n=1 Tax=Sphingobium indicum F2 TaxID=1450518 RepID=A0A8E0WPL6_9SPHN|nr:MULTISPECIES: GNAT family N-acetyltransferase [Sphingobium]EPR16849.1 CelD-like protein [Sphingobium indicum IP26]EQA97593.1 CelD-like protein [Sphingobium sp. HDIP04]KER35141.1 CelD-like protein [Sphingobium indicum F2]
MALTAHFTRLPDLASLAPRWQALESRAAASFFLGWTWTGAWLESYAVRPELLAVIDAQGRDVALALFGHALQPRLLGRSATLSLNQSGDPGADRPFIEYNGLLAAKGREGEAAQAALQALQDRNDWRTLRLDGIAPDSPLLTIPARRKTRLDRSPVYQVDLAAVRAADYLSLLSANSRSQIRRALKDHDGTLPAIAKADPADIVPWLEEMQSLNTGRHADNAWDDPAFRRFAATLASRDEKVELLRLTDSGGTVGLLLNFLHDGIAMNYQSAFAAPRTAKDKPGLLCHAAAVAHYAERGLALYSLLAGKDRYKQSLATREEALEWWQVDRFSPRLEAEAALRKLLRRPASA